MALHSRWKLPAPVPDNHAARSLGFPKLMGQLLYNRGLNESSQIQSFLTGGSPVADLFLLPDMSQAVARTCRALLSGETIAVYGDFDVDGVTSTALLVEGLTALGGRVVPYIPHRITEGYGLKLAALEKLSSQGVSLVITVDCGITAVDEVREAQRLGLDIIITDHHTVPQTMPDAIAVVNPKRADSTYPFPDLAGVGVAFKLLQALSRALGKPGSLDKTIDLVALGTIADVVPLLGENRYFARRGLEQLNTSPRVGIGELVRQCGLSGGRISSDDVSWVLAPRLNAAGRLEHALTSYRLLLTESPEEAGELAARLVAINEQRQRLTTEFVARAREQVLTKGISLLLLVCGPDYPEGIAGLIASQLSEEFYRPAVVVRAGEKLSRGSCRSIPEFNIIQALTECGSLFTQFGGHSQAAGFSMPTGNLAELEQCLLRQAEKELAGLDLRPQIEIDVVVNLRELGGNTFPMLQKLAPFGSGNPEPVFLSRKVDLLDCAAIGNDGCHLKLKLKQGGVVWDGVAFGLGSCLNELSSPVDIVYNLTLEKWNGEERLRLNVLDFCPIK